MKIFIVGSSGYIGQRLIKSLQSKYEYFEVIRNAKHDQINLDLEEAELFDYDIISKGDFIIFLSAISSPDICKNNYEYAYNINVKGTSYFLDKCIKKECNVLFFSSDIVYGKQETVLDESSICNPIDPYGKMKRIIEEKFFEFNQFKIFRLSYVFSKEDKYMRYLMSSADSGKTAEIYHPFYRNIIYIEDVIDAVLNLIENWEKYNNTVFNIVGSELLSRLDLAKIYEKNIDKRLIFEKVIPNEEFFKARPKVIETRSVFLNDLLEKQSTKILDAMIKEFTNERENTQ